MAFISSVFAADPPSAVMPQTVSPLSGAPRVNPGTGVPDTNGLPLTLPAIEVVTHRLDQVHSQFQPNFGQPSVSYGGRVGTID